eukprot:gb/GECG01000466.1/.p1 GENE.gb/GECG01000466.1/~~gb/GECG01000466.1/.p1  ORF type:complete len:294 (+),score=25.53 gb/GECG01000466.1/:1-882(+)
MHAVKNLSRGPQRLWTSSLSSLSSIQARLGCHGVKLPSASASTAANESSTSSKSEQKQHPMLDYSHPSQPGARPYEYTDPMRDYGWHLSGAFFERPHVRRYTDHFQGDGKLFTASAEPLQGKDVVPLFEVPNIESRRLSDDSPCDVNKELQSKVKGKVSLVTVAFSGIGLKNQDLSQWHDAFLKHCANDTDKFNMCHLKYMDGFEYYFAPSVFRRLNQSAVPSGLESSSYVVFEPYHYNITLFTELASIHNRAYGFVYLVDQEGQIRWRAHGLPEHGETDAMVKCAEGLAKSK